jgi:hypothetical protein
MLGEDERKMGKEKRGTQEGYSGIRYTYVRDRWYYHIVS